MSDELPDDDFQSVSAIEGRRISSSGDYSETPPPPPGVPNTSREAVHGSDRTPITLSPAQSDLPTAAVINDSLRTPIIADPISHIEPSRSPSSTLTTSQATQPITDPVSAVSRLVPEASVTTQPFYVPSVPDFSQETVQASLAVTESLADPNFLFSKPGGSGCNHPADPENTEDFIDRAILAEVVELGFEESIAILALSKIKVGGTEAAINWILEHSNASDFESDNEDANMGAAQSSSSSLGSQKMVLVVNMSLKMGTGKLAAQVGHATLGVYKLAQRSDEGQRALDAWRLHGEMKVVVKGPNIGTLLDLFKQAKDVGLFAYIVSDAGRTQIPAGSRTVLGVFGPSDVVDSVTGQLKLL